MKRFFVLLLCLMLLLSTACAAPAKKTTEATQNPTTVPTEATQSPTTVPTEGKATEITDAPTEESVAEPTTLPAPTEKPVVPTTETTIATRKPTTVATEKPTVKPTTAPTEKPTTKPTAAPTTVSTERPAETPTVAPTKVPTKAPTEAPTEEPVVQPTSSEVYYTYTDDYGNSFKIPYGVDIFDYTLSQAKLPAVTSRFPELEKLIYQKTNAEREKEGLPALEWEEGAYFFANTRAYEASVLWAHTRPNGESYDHIFAEYKVLCNNGENLYSYYSSTMDAKYIASKVGTEALAESAITGWMNSPGHRANILEEMWESMIVGVYYDEQAQKLFAVQLFFG